MSMGSTQVEHAARRVWGVHRTENCVRNGHKTILPVFMAVIGPRHRDVNL